MTYIVEDHFLPGIPQTIVEGGLPSRAIVGHWTVGATGRAGALGTARFFVDRADRNASYHEIWWWDSASRAFGVLRIVPPNHIAHSMNPNRPPWRDPPLDNVQRLLGDKWWNPNAYSYAVSFAGAAVSLADAMGDPLFVAYCARRVRELVAQEPTLTDPERPIFTHAEGQDNKSDWGLALTPAIYSLLNVTLPDAALPNEDDMELIPKGQRWKPTVTNGTSNGVFRDKPDRAAPVFARVTPESVVRTFVEVRTSAYQRPRDNGDWRVTMLADGRRAFMLRADWEALFSPTDPVAQQALVDYCIGQGGNTQALENKVSGGLTAVDGALRANATVRQAAEAEKVALEAAQATLK